MPPPRIKLEEQRDFTGGWNLADDGYNLEPDESFDLQDVDIDRRGGFGIRRGSKRFITAECGLAVGAPDSGYTYVDPSNVRHILVARGGEVRRWDGAAWQNVRAAFGGTGRTRFVEFNNALYSSPPGLVPHKWTGSGTSTSLTTTVGNYNDDLTAPNNGNFPQCNTMVVWHNAMWAGGVAEASGTKDNRLRWSHPFNPEDWRTDDWIDIDPDDENGRIRALVPFGERLLVFKDRAIYAVHGYPPDGFSVQELTKSLGTPSQWSVKATENAVYFWDTDRGLWSFDGSDFNWDFEPLYPLIDDRKIHVQFSFQTILEIHNDRVWLSVPYLAPPYANLFVSLVFAPNVGKEGAWTIHTATLFGWWIHRGSDGGDIHLVGGDDTGGGAGNGYLYELDVENFWQDEAIIGVGTFEMQAIPAHYTTRWFDGKVSVQKKRWKRPEFVLRAGANQVTVAEVVTDYDPTKVVKTFQLSTVLPSEVVEQTYLELNAAGEYASESHAGTSAFTPAGTLLLGADIDPVAISTGTPQTLASHWDSSGAGANHSYLFQISGSGFLRIITTPDGTVASQIISTCTTVLPDATRRTVWVEFNPDNGANRVVKFYTSNTISGEKTQLGATITSTITSINPLPAYTLDIGTITPGGIESFAGKVYALQMSDDGVVKGQPMFTLQAPGATDFFDALGIHWLIQDGATLVGETLVITEEGIWDLSIWDQMFWARELTASGERSAVVRGAPLGGGRAKAIRLRPTSMGQDWRVHGVTFKWIGKRIRN